MRARGARLWLKASVCGHTIPVYVCRPKHKFLSIEEGETLLGVFDPDTNTIAISANQPPETAKETLLHELLHAYFHLSGVGHTFLKNNGKLEEDIIRTLSPHLFGGLTLSGLLRIPRPPKV